MSVKKTQLKTTVLVCLSAGLLVFGGGYVVGARYAEVTVERERVLLPLKTESRFNMSTAESNGWSLTVWTSSSVNAFMERTNVSVRLACRGGSDGEPPRGKLHLVLRKDGAAAREHDYVFWPQFDEPREFIQWHWDKTRAEGREDGPGWKAVVKDAIRFRENRPPYTPLEYGDYTLDVGLVLEDDTSLAVEGLRLRWVFLPH
jgi:hypothetical protein